MRAYFIILCCTIFTAAAYADVSLSPQELAKQAEENCMWFQNISPREWTEKSPSDKQNIKAICQKNYDDADDECSALLRCKNKIKPGQFAQMSPQKLKDFIQECKRTFMMEWQNFTPNMISPLYDAPNFHRCPVYAMLGNYTVLPCRDELTYSDWQKFSDAEKYAFSDNCSAKIAENKRQNEARSECLWIDGVDMGKWWKNTSAQEQENYKKNCVQRLDVAGSECGVLKDAIWECGCSIDKKIWLNMSYKEREDHIQACRKSRDYHKKHESYDCADDPLMGEYVVFPCQDWLSLEKRITHKQWIGMTIAQKKNYSNECKREMKKLHYD